MEHKSDGIPIIIGALGTVIKGLVQGVEDLEIRERDHPNDSIIRDRSDY